MSSSAGASPLAVLATIAVGAVLGAWLRYGLAEWLNARGWLPLGTLLANAMGGFLVGIALAWLSARPEVSPLLRLFIVTGFLGALTTFSTFSAEVVGLLMAEAWGRALALIALHLALSLALTWLGFTLIRA
ncbi:MAG: fluoride efflux transporter CrcB [Casimicrobiaceae bacterium]|nr:fluoride efflux transporter CrcB [Casimicrobiaceae bacterium]